MYHIRGTYLPPLPPPRGVLSCPFLHVAFCQGVHMNVDLVIKLMQIYPNCIPFYIYISDPVRYIFYHSFIQSLIHCIGSTQATVCHKSQKHEPGCSGQQIRQIFQQHSSDIRLYLF